MKRVHGKTCTLYWHFIKESFGVWAGKSVMTEATKATVWTPYKSVMTYTQWQSPVADLDP